jgi:hypothetical protein
MISPRTALLVAIAAAILAFAMPASADPTNVRMQNVIRSFVAETGEEVIGLGSWISSRNYRDVLAGGTSDHDMRLVCRGESPDALRRWQAARQRLAGMIRSEFGRDADRVLRTVNLYPPSQLMAGVENAADAVNRFGNLGQVPNLSVSGVPRNAAPFAEGLYGGGARAWTQGYEQSAGRLFYREGDKVFMGMTDLTHMSEGVARHNIEGMVNTSRQWLSHIDDAIAAGDRNAIAKYLDRLNRDLAKAKNLGRLEMDMAFRTEMNQLSRALKSGTGNLGALRGRLDAVVTRAGREVKVLGIYARSGATVRRILGVVLQTGAAGDRLRRIVSEAGEALTFEKAVQAVVLYVELRKSLAYAAEDDFHRAYRSALAGTIGMANLPAGIITELGGCALDAIDATGIDLVASTQEAWNLMAGLHTVYGREDVDAGRGYTLQDLVRHIDDESRLEALVRLKAKIASERGFSGVAATTDARVAEAVFRRCWPVIRDAWRLEREKLTAEFEVLCMEMTLMPVLMSYEPNPARATAGGKTEITVTARVRDPGFDARRARLKEIIDLLCHTSTYVNTAWRWKGGVEGREPWIRKFSFEGSGRKPVELALDVRVGSTGKWRESPYTRDLTCVSGLDVMIEGSDSRPETPATPATLAASGTTRLDGFVKIEGVALRNSTFSWNPSGNKSDEQVNVVLVPHGKVMESTAVEISGRAFTGVSERTWDAANRMTITCEGTFSADRRMIEKLTVTARHVFTGQGSHVMRETRDWTLVMKNIPFTGMNNGLIEYAVHSTAAGSGFAIEKAEYLGEYVEEGNPYVSVPRGTVPVMRTRTDRMTLSASPPTISLKFTPCPALPVLTPRRR